MATPEQLLSDLDADLGIEVGEDAEPRANPQAEPVELTADELAGIAKREFQNSESFQTEYFADLRARLTEYYHGEVAELSDVSGRSQYVSLDVHDVVHGVLYDVVETFAGADSAVEFVPFDERDVAEARQKTDYINQVVLQQDNDGLALVDTLAKDAMIRFMGVAKYWWEPVERVRTETYEGQTVMQLGILAEDPEAEFLGDPLPSGVAPDGQTLYDVTVRYVQATGRARVMAIPSEEFYWDRNARSLHISRMFAHRPSRFTVGQCVELGFAAEEVAEYATDTQIPARTYNAQELQARAPWETRYSDNSVGMSAELASRVVDYKEIYLKVDADGDGVQEWRCLQCFGPGFDILRNEVVERPPFALFVPDGAPHSLISMKSCQAAKVADIQYTKSAIGRAQLDSLAKVVDPQFEVDERMIRMGDVTSPAITKYIRSKQIGSIRQIPHEFVGAQAFPMVEYLDGVIEARVGKRSIAVDLDAMQSTTKSGVDAAVRGAQAPKQYTIRMLARGFVDLFKGLESLLKRNQDVPRTVRLRNEWVEVDPASWHVGMDVVPNVGLGPALPAERMAMVAERIEEQKEQIATYGPNGPMVGWSELHASYDELMRLGGRRDTVRFFKDPATWQPPPPPPPEPDPAVMVAQAELQKAESDLVDSQTKQFEAQTARMKMIADARLKELEILQKGQVAGANLLVDFEKIAEQARVADVAAEVATEPVETVQVQA